MKRTLMVLLELIVVTSFAYAALQTHSVEGNLVEVITQIRSVSATSSTRLGNLKQTGADIVQTYGDDINVEDQTKIAAYSALVTTAKNALDAVVTYADTNWSSID